MKITRAVAVQAMTCLCLGLSVFAFGDSQKVKVDKVVVPGVVHRSLKIGHSNPNRLLHISVSLPYGDQAGMEAFVSSVSDPKSPMYRQYITPEEVGNRFGLSADKVQAVADYLKSQGMKVNLVAKNHLSILADCSSAQAETAFGTVINDYQANDPHEPGNTNFFSYSTQLSVPSTIAPFIQSVSGMENFTKPQVRALTPTQTRVLYNTAPMYNAGVQGQNRNLAISNFDGYRLTNVPLYYSHFGLPTPAGGVGSNVHVVTVSGGAGGGTASGEGDLDIQMVLGMAPLCQFYIYDGGASDLIGVLTKEVNDNLVQVISESYGWNLPAATATSAHNLHLSMSAQGITYMAASGDSGTTIEPYSYPDYEPEVLQIGGTVATTDASGNRTSEPIWTSGGGGWSTNTATFNVRPSWQTGTGVPNNNKRLVPDIAFNAGGSGAYQFYLNGALSSAYVGTSFASPVFCGMLGVAEQQIMANGGLASGRFGRIQDLIYSQNNRSDVYFDITTGSNGTLPDGTTSNAHVGWDYCVGWGPMNMNNFVATQGAGTPPGAPSNLVATAGNAQVSLTWSAGTGATGYNIKRATVSGGPYTTVGTSTTTSFTNSGLTNGTTYYYVVTSTNTAGESGNSNQASATPNVSVPSAPTNLVATAGNAQVSLTWTGSSGATSYNVKDATTSGGPYTTVGSTSSTSLTVSGLTNGTTYFFVVTAVNGAGESGNSNQASAAPSGGGGGAQLLLNPGFESGNVNWVASSGVIGQYGGSGEPTHGGTWDAWMDGYGTSHTDTMYQQVAIPSTVTTATLQFYLHIDTAETTTTTAYDTLKVQIRNSSNTVLATLATYSNLNKAAGYSLKSFDVSAYKGQTIRVYFLGVEDTSLQTSFVIDDTALNTN
jgi:subtilase family serine protease